MKKDFRNTIITFGLIALVFFGGSFAYQEKIQQEYALVIKQENLQFQKIKNERLAKLEQSKLLDQIKQNELEKQQIAKQIQEEQEEQLAMQNFQNQNSLNQAAAVQAQLNLAKQQALVLAQQQALAQAQANAQAQASAQIAVVKPSRKSKAS